MKWTPASARLQRKTCPEELSFVQKREIIWIENQNKPPNQYHISAIQMFKIFIIIVREKRGKKASRENQNKDKSFQWIHLLSLAGKPACKLFRVANTILFFVCTIQRRPRTLMKFQRAATLQINNNNPLNLCLMQPWRECKWDYQPAAFIQQNFSYGSQPGIHIPPPKSVCWLQQSK